MLGCIDDLKLSTGVPLVPHHSPTQALTHTPGTPDTVPGFQLALATAASVYFFRENKKVKLGTPAVWWQLLAPSTPWWHKTNATCPTHAPCLTRAPVQVQQWATQQRALWWGPCLGACCKTGCAWTSYPLGCVDRGLTMRKHTHVVHPAQSFDSPAALVSEFAIVALWAVCTFLG